MNALEMFYAGGIVGCIAGATAMWAYLSLREIRPRRDRRNRLPLPDDRVYRPRGRR